jgi:hypothetical protein
VQEGRATSFGYFMQTKPVIYTREFVDIETKFLLKRLLEGSEFIFLGELIEDRPYTMNRFGEWAKTFKEDDEISGTIGKIKNILETRAVSGGLKNKLSPVMTKFHLINNFDWRDKTEVDHTTKGESFGNLTSAQLAIVADAEAKLLEKL